VLRLNKKYLQTCLISFSIISFSVNLPVQAQQNKISATKIYSQALYHKNKKEFKKAIKLFREYNSFTQGNELSYRNLAESYLSAGQLEWAIISIKKALKFAPKNTNNMYFLGSLLSGQNNKKAALKIMNTILSIDSHHTRAMFLKANIFLRMGHSSQAAANLRDVFFESKINGVKNSTYQKSVLLLGNLYLSSKQYIQARFYYEKYYEVVRTNKSILVKLGHINKILSDLANAKKYYVLALKIDNTIPDALESLGEIYYIEGNTKAKFYFDRRVRQFKNKNVPPLLYGLYLDLNNDVVDGVEIDSGHYIKKVLQKDPKSLSAIMYTIRRAKKEKDAISYDLHIREAIVLANGYKLYNPASDLCWEVLKIKQGNSPEIFKNSQLKIKTADVYEFLGGIYDNKKQFSRAIVSYKQSLHFLKEKNEDNNTQKRRLEINIKLLQSYLGGDSDHWRSGLRLAKRLEKKHTQNSQILFLKAHFYIRLNKIKKAKQTLKEGIILDENFDYLYYYYAVLSELQGNKDDIERYLKICLKKNPKNADALNFLGYYYLENEQNLDEALALIRKAILLKPNSVAIRDSIGWGYYKNKKLKEAKNHLQIAVEMAEIHGIKDAVIYDHLAQIFYDKSDYSHSLFFWKEADKILSVQIRGAKENKTPDKDHRKKWKLKKKIEKLIRKVKSQIQLKSY